MATILYPDGTTKRIYPTNSSTGFSLEELREAIGGGWIEIVRTQTGRRILVIDEEGKLKGMPLNSRASGLYDPTYSDVIVGIAILATNKEVQ